jgi:NhaA family Na+:H+ antiporter
LLPGAAALGGMVVPALIYLAFNPSGPERDGWGIVIATDIAFALGVLALLSRFVPQQARVFLLAVAIFDDLGAIAVIAVFFTDSISVQALVVAFCVAAAFYLVRNYAVDNPLVLAIFAVVLWGAVEQSGIHATIAGVLLAALVPLRSIASQQDFHAAGSELMLQYSDAVEAGRHNEADVILGRIEEAARDTEAPLERLEREIVPLSGFVVIPIFALANAGIEIGGNTFPDVLTTSLGLGVLFGLLVGKPVGIVGATLLATRLGFATLPGAIRLREVVGIGLLAGIGFTVSIFVTGLALDGQEHVDVAKAAIFVAFLASTAIGFLFLRMTARSSG